MGRLIGVLGSSGFAREVMPLVRAQVERDEPEAELVFVDRTAADPVNGIRVLAEEDFLARDDERGFIIAIADTTLRRKLYKKAVETGAKALSVRARSAEQLDRVTIGDGAILCGMSMLTSNVRVGVGFHLNIYSYVAHDCVIGDFVTFAPKVACNGNVVIEDNAYIGAGAVIREGKPGEPVVIGAGATVGMGAVVIKSVAPGAVVAGNPARPIR